MSAALSGARADKAWELIWFLCGPEGSRIRLERGVLNVPYKAGDADLTLDPMVVKLRGFLDAHPYSPIIDAETLTGIDVLKEGIKGIMAGTKTADAVAKEYEARIASNDPARKNR